MFEGITTAAWLTGMAVAALGAGLFGLIKPLKWRVLGLVVWLVAPGLLGAATSSVSSPGEFLGIAILVELFVGIPWILSSLVAFAVVRLLVRGRQRSKPE